MIGSSRDWSARNIRYAEKPCGTRPNQNPKIGPIHALLQSRGRVKAMQKLIEFYEMASLNAAALGDREKMAIVEARRGLRLFARAMESFKMGTVEAEVNADVKRRMAQWEAAQEVRPR
jgi:hypothetical protein